MNTVDWSFLREPRGIGMVAFFIFWILAGLLLFEWMYTRRAHLTGLRCAILRCSAGVLYFVVGIIGVTLIGGFRL